MTDWRLNIAVNWALRGEVCPSDRYIIWLNQDVYQVSCKVTCLMGDTRFKWRVKYNEVQTISKSCHVVSIGIRSTNHVVLVPPWLTLLVSWWWCNVSALGDDVTQCWAVSELWLDSPYIGEWLRVYSGVIRLGLLCPHPTLYLLLQGVVQVLFIRPHAARLSDSPCTTIVITLGVAGTLGTVPCVALLRWQLSLLRQIRQSPTQLVQPC